jgi:putative peptide-modifying radical SAM enzyme
MVRLEEGEVVDGLGIYVTLTTRCNLKCSYCYGKSCEDFGSDFHGLEIDYSIPPILQYDIGVLRDFLKDDPEPRIVFYGGEPLLEIRKLKEIMKAFPRARFVIQTNGLLLDKLDSEYTSRFESIFVSLDGDEELTDFYRGKGTYGRVASNLRRIRENGFVGEVVARMTVDEQTEIDKQVLALAFNRDMPISSVHWQLDALFWQNDYAKRNFSDWIESSYNPRVRALIRLWVERMRTDGEVLRLYPLLGVMASMLKGERSRLRCGAGWSMFNIQTDGKITPCPVMAGMKKYYLGDISTSILKQLRTAGFASSPCSKCEILEICGGRCLYANVTQLWGPDGFSQVCGTVHNMVEALREVKPEVERLIQLDTISLGQFEYAKYNGCEIIP